MDLWVVIDAQVRRDLIPFVTDPERRLVRCKHCGKEDPRQEHMLVLLRDPRAPIGLLLPGTLNTGVESRFGYARLRR